MPEATPSETRKGEPVLAKLPPHGARLNQRWQVVKTKHGYLIKNVASEMCLVPHRPTADTPKQKVTLVSVKGDGNPEQSWNVTKTQHGWLIVNVQSGRALVPLVKTMNEDGGKLCLFNLAGTGGVNHQSWHFRPIKSSGP
jgi:hypothetical protein